MSLCLFTAIQFSFFLKLSILLLFYIFLPHSQIFEIVNLANELLPPLPQGTISLPANFSVVVKGFVVKNLSAPPQKQEGTDSSGPENSAREKLIIDHPELLQQFGMDLLPVLIQVSLFMPLPFGVLTMFDRK